MAQRRRRFEDTAVGWLLHRLVSSRVALVVAGVLAGIAIALLVLH